MNEIDAHIEEVRGVVRQKQIKIALNSLSWIENVWNFKNMTALRPTGAFEGNTRRWWRFAIEVHQIRVQQSRQNFRWSEVKRTFRLAKEYIALYQRKCRDDRPWLEDLSETELERLDTIESSGIGYKALSEWRCIAWDKLCEEDAKEYKRAKRSGVKQPKLRMTTDQMDLLDGRRCLLLPCSWLLWGGGGL